MKKQIIIALILIAFGIINFNCRKYPEGPGFSLRSKKNRLCQDWKLVNYYYDDIDYTDHKLQIFTLYEMNINKDGTMYLFTSSYMPQTSTIHTVEIHGTWEFSEDKRHFYFTEQYTNDNTQPQPLLGGVRHDYFILKLFEKEMAVRETLDGHTNKYYFNRK